MQLRKLRSRMVGKKIKNVLLQPQSRGLSQFTFLLSSKHHLDLGCWTVKEDNINHTSLHMNKILSMNYFFGRQAGRSFQKRSLVWCCGEVGAGGSHGDRSVGQCHQEGL